MLSKHDAGLKMTLLGNCGYPRRIIEHIIHDYPSRVSDGTFTNICEVSHHWR